MKGDVLCFRNGNYICNFNVFSFINLSIEVIVFFKTSGYNSVINIGNTLSLFYLSLKCLLKVIIFTFVFFISYSVGFYVYKTMSF